MSRLEKLVIMHAKQFNYDKYWKRFFELTSSKTNKLLRLYYKYYLKRVNFKNGADIGFPIGEKSNFASAPILSNHGLLGIVIASGAVIGKNVTISHQVTIGRSRNGAPVIGNDVYIGPGAKIFGAIKIGNNVRIGANCVVFEDVQDNTTVVLPKPRIIMKDSKYKYFVADGE